VKITGLAALAVLLSLLAGCAGTPSGEYDMADAMAEYCDQAGARRTTANTQTTVQHWDDEATTAGHRGTLTDDVLEPDLNQARPHGC